MNNILKTSRSSQDVFLTKLEQASKIQKESEKYVDIYDLFPVLYEIFKNLGVLADSEGEKKKLSFKFAYPDELYKNSETVVTFDIGRREIANINGRSQLKSTHGGTVKDFVSGQVVQYEEGLMSNYVELTVYSESFQEMLQITRYIESVFKKHKGLIRQRVLSCNLDHISGSKFYQNNASNSIHSKTLVYHVITQEYHSMMYEETQQIKQ